MAAAVVVDDQRRRLGEPGGPVQAGADRAGGARELEVADLGDLDALPGKDACVTAAALANGLDRLGLEPAIEALESQGGLRQRVEPDDSRM